MSTPNTSRRDAFARDDHPAKSILTGSQPTKVAPKKAARAGGGGPVPATVGTKAFLVKMTPQMHRDIKIAATMRDTTMNQLALDAITKELARDNT